MSQIRQIEIDMIEKVKEIARLNGACNIMKDVTNWEEMANLLFSPKGREFCQNNNFPDLQTWSKIRSVVDTEQFGIYIDSDMVSLDNPENTGLIGLTTASINYHGTDKTHRLFIQHGAKAKITVSEYAVLLIVKCPECDVEIDNDGTGIILYD